MKIISISGLDGSGKSTQINLLQKYLESQGKRVFCFHAIQFGIANNTDAFLKKHAIFRRPSRNDTGRNEKKGVMKANVFQIWLRKIFLRIDIYRFKDLAKKLEKEGFDYIISDRYFYDNIVNIEYLQSKNTCHSCESRNPENKEISGSRIKCGMTKNIIRPDVSICLKTDPEIIMQRERIPDQGIDYLKKKKELYDKKIKEWDWKVIDGNRDEDVIFKEIKNYV